VTESDQKFLKVGIHSFPARRSAFKRVSVEIGRQVRSLIRRSKRSLHCLLVEVPWQIN